MEFQQIKINDRARKLMALNIISDPEWLRQEAEHFVDGNYGEHLYLEWVDTRKTVMPDHYILRHLLFGLGFGLSRGQIAYMYFTLTQEQQEAADKVLEKVMKERFDHID